MPRLLERLSSMRRTRGNAPAAPPPAAPLPVGDAERRSRPLPRVNATPSPLVLRKPPMPLPLEKEYREDTRSPASKVDIRELIKEDFSDLTIRTSDGPTYNCHKVLMSAVSPYILTKLKRQSAENKVVDPILTLPDVNSTIFEYILRYVYSDEIWIPLNEVLDVGIGSQKLQITFLYDKCITFLSRAFNLFWKTDEFLKTPISFLRAIINHSQFCVTSEDDLFSAVERWREHDIKGRKSYIEELMDGMHFEMCTVDFLYGTVCNSDMMQTVKSLRRLLKASFYHHLANSQFDLQHKKFHRLYQESATDQSLLVMRPEAEMNRSLNQLRYKQLFTDVTINASDGSVSCHKYVLCEVSSYYKAMFRSGMRETTENEINFEEIGHVHLNSLIDYIYTREFIPTKSNVVDMLRYGHLLELENLVGECSRFMLANTTTETCLSYNRLSQLYSISDLHVISQRCLLGFFDEVLESADFMELDPVELINLVKDERITVKDEKRLYDAVQKWACHDEERRLSCVDDILAYVKPYDLEPSPKKHEVQCRNSMDTLTEERTLKAQARSFKAQTMMEPRAKSGRKGLIQSHIIVPTRINGICLYYVAGESEWKTFMICEDRQVCNAGSVYHASNGKFIQMGGGVGLDEQWWMATNLNETWQRMPEMTSSIRYYTCCIDEHWMYVVGGWCDNGHQKCMHAWSFGNKKWTKMAPMSTAVSNPIVLMYNNQLYVCGGYNGEFQDTLQVYDTLTTSWSNKAKMPLKVSRQEAGGVVFEDKLFFFTTDTCMTYCPSVNRWKLTKFNNMPRMSCPIVWQGQIIVNASSNVSGSTTAGKCIRFHTYNVSSETWSELTSIPDIRGYDSHGSCVSNRCFCANMSVV